MNIDAKIIAAYKRTIEAEHNDAEFGTAATRRAVTRAANTLSRKIKECYPNIDMAGKIKLRTKLQELA
jgi:hypothetical protein